MTRMVSKNEKFPLSTYVANKIEGIKFDHALVAM